MGAYPPVKVLKTGAIKDVEGGGRQQQEQVVHVMRAEALALCPSLCHPEVGERRSLAALAALPPACRVAHDASTSRASGARDG